MSTMVTAINNASQMESFIVLRQKQDFWLCENGAQQLKWSRLNIGPRAENTLK